jgi:hypothetical protein
MPKLNHLHKGINMKEIALFILFAGLFFTMGFVTSELYDVFSYNKQVEGVHLENYANWSSAYEKARSYDYGGDWVCVNVRGMSFERALEVCKHEVAHEIFAEYCERGNNIDKCMEITK